MIGIDICFYHKSEATRLGHIRRQLLFSLQVTKLAGGPILQLKTGLVDTWIAWIEHQFRVVVFLQVRKDMEYLVHVSFPR